MAYSTGSIDQRESGRWRARAHFVDREGKGQRLTRSGFRTKAEARDWLKQVHADGATGDLVKPRDDVRFRDYLHGWNDAREDALQIKPGTASGYRDKITQVPDWLNKPIGKVTSQHLNTFYGEYLAGGGHQADGRKSPRSVLYMHRMIRKALAHAVAEGVVRTNVADTAIAPSAGAARSTERHVLSLDETQRFLAWSFAELPAYRSIAWLLAFSTGARRQDLAGWRWQDFDGENIVCAVARSPYKDRTGKVIVIEGTHKTERGRRTIALHESTVRRLEQWRAEQRRAAFKAGKGRCEHILTNADLGSWHPDSISQMWRKDIRQAVAEGVVDQVTTLHDCRHWHATQLIADGVDLNTVANRLGHANAAFTLSVYGHSDPARDRQAAEKVGAALGF